MGRIVDKPDVGQDLLRRPAAGHQSFARLARIGRRPDGLHHLVDIRDGDGQTAEDVAPLPRLAQQVGGAPGHYILAEIDEGRQEAPQGQCFGPPAVEGEHVAAEIGLHRGEAEKLVHHHFGGGVALQLHHDAHAAAVGFVLHMGDAVDLLFAHLFRDLFDHRGFVHLIGNLVDDNGVAVLADLLHPGLGAHDDAAAPLKVGFARAGTAQHDPARGEIGAGDVFDQLFASQVRVFDQRQRGIDNLAEVMGRDVGGHADGNTARTVDQHVGIARGQNRRFTVLAVIVVLKIDGIAVDVFQQILRGLFHPHFGVAIGGGLVAIHGAEVALTVEQHEAHGKVLRHAHQRVIDRRVAVGVVFTHGLRHRARGFAVRLVVRVSGFMHRVKDAAVHRLQPVAQVRNGPADDDRHRIVEIGIAHLFFDADGRPVVHRPLWPVFVIGFRGFGRIAHVIDLSLSASISCVIPYQNPQDRRNACGKNTLAATDAECQYAVFVEK